MSKLSICIDSFDSKRELTVGNHLAKVGAAVRRAVAGPSPPYSTDVLVQHGNAHHSLEEIPMADDPNRVWPSGLTTPEAEELQRGLVEGTRVFSFIAILAHVLAYAYSPWLH